MDLLKKALTYMYLGATGINFYKSDNLVNIDAFSHMVVKTIYQYNITFYFCHFEVFYMKNRWLWCCTKNYKLYKVYVRFDGGAPDILKRLPNTITLSIPKWVATLIDNKIRVDWMINAYLDLAINEFKKTS